MPIGSAARRRRDAPVDLGLLEGAAEQHPAEQQHDEIADQEEDAFAARRQAADEHLGAEVRVVAQRDHGAEKRQPDEEPARQLLRDGDPGVEDVAQHDVAEHEHDHRHQAEGDDHLEDPAVAVDGIRSPRLRAAAGSRSGQMQAPDWRSRFCGSALWMRASSSL